MLIGVAKKIFAENKPARAVDKDLYMILYGFSLKLVVIANNNGNIAKIETIEIIIKTRTKFGATNTVASSCNTAKNDAEIT